MSTKASTAALDPISQRLFLRQRRASRHPASGQKLQEGMDAERRIQRDAAGKALD